MLTFNYTVNNNENENEIFSQLSQIKNIKVDRGEFFPKFATITMPENYEIILHTLNYFGKICMF